MTYVGPFRYGPHTSQGLESRIYGTEKTCLLGGRFFEDHHRALGIFLL